MKKFKKADKVKTNFGTIETVISQNGNQVFTKESVNAWYHPNNLVKI